VDFDFIFNAFYGSLSCAWWLSGFSGSVALWLCGEWPTWLGNPRQCPTTDWRPATVAKRNDSLDPLDPPPKTCPGSQFVRRPGKPLDYVIYLFSHAR